MNLSAENVGLWNGIIQFGILSGAILVAYWLYHHCRPIRKSMMPVAVCGGFLLLAAKYLGLKLDDELMEAVVYHALGFGFIASALRSQKSKEKQNGEMTGVKSGALIVSTYLVQGILGLIISLFLAYTFMPDLFKACGILLPMGFGQGPGQANNVGTILESSGFAGGRSFGLAIAAMGYLMACIIGVVMLNVLRRRNAIQNLAAADKQEPSENVPENYSAILPVSLDALSLQAAIITMIYLVTYLASKGLTSGLAALVPGVAATVSPLIWGFNFIIGSAFAMLYRSMVHRFRKDEPNEVVLRQADGILNRISGVCFDFMIVAGIASIRVEDIRALWVPFLLMTVLGGIATWLFLKTVCRRIYPDYYCQGLIAMFGMLTGTISSGVLLLREIDPELSSPAANQLLIGSGFAIILGAPMLLLISICPRSEALTWISLGIMVVYLALLLLLIYHRKKVQAAAQN